MKITLTLRPFRNLTTRVFAGSSLLYLLHLIISSVFIYGRYKNAEKVNKVISVFFFFLNFNKSMFSIIDFYWRFIGEPLVHVLILQIC